MYVSTSIVEALHNERVREAQKSAHSHVISDFSEVQPNVVEEGLLIQFRQWVQARRQFRGANARHAHAV
jgi:hypothetical protein